MDIGGSDILIEAPPDAPVGELILARVRLLWPDAWFQDAEDDDAHPIMAPWVAVRGSRSREFFLYRDRDAVSSWTLEGAMPENMDRMLYFIIAPMPPSRDMPRQVTLVCGARTLQVDQLINDLAASFKASRFPALVA